MAMKEKVKKERRTGDRRTSGPDQNLEWSEKFLTGIRAIDSDHKNLFEEIGILEQRLNRGADAKAIANAISSLQKYCTDHFAREEQFMEKAHYPGLKSHRKEHKRYSKLIKQLSKLHAKDPAQIDPSKVLEFLNSWLANHIIGLDLKYVPYVAGEKTVAIRGEAHEVVSAPIMESLTLAAPQKSIKTIKEFHTLLLEGGVIADALVEVVEQLRKKRNKALKKDAIKLFCKKEKGSS